jgi:hypothetical protein
MNAADDALDRTLSALKSELVALRPPPSVDRALAAAIGRAERARKAPERALWDAFRNSWLPAAFAFAASLAIVVWTLRAPEAPSRPPTVATPAGTEFIPVVPVSDIAGTRGAYVVSTQVPRTMLADFGLPVSPVRAAEPVRGELLVRGDGTILAVRFLE